VSVSWFSDPVSLREMADVYDGFAEDEANEAIAGAWRGKARALRSRAGAIERLSQPTIEES
jgi:hypothetical protein